VEPGILLDLQGPKIRTGEIENGSILLKKVRPITFTGAPCPGTVDRVSISYDRLGEEVAPAAASCWTMAAGGGVESVSARMSLPRGDGRHPETPQGGQPSRCGPVVNPITEKDKADLYFGIDSGCDFIALSFVRSSAEVVSLKKMIHQFGKRIRSSPRSKRPKPSRTSMRSSTPQMR
jgi:pyruvate kinase